MMNFFNNSLNSEYEVKSSKQLMFPVSEVFQLFWHRRRHLCWLASWVSRLLVMFAHTLWRWHSGPFTSCALPRSSTKRSDSSSSRHRRITVVFGSCIMHDYLSLTFFSRWRSSRHQFRSRRSFLVYCNLHRATVIVRFESHPFTLRRGRESHL